MSHPAASLGRGHGALLRTTNDLHCSPNGSLVASRHCTAHFMPLDTHCTALHCTALHWAMRWNGSPGVGTGHSAPAAAHCSAHCSAHCTALHCTAHCLHTAHWSLHTAHCTLHTPHCTLHTAVHCNASQELGSPPLIARFTQSGAVARHGGGRCSQAWWGPLYGGGRCIHVVSGEGSGWFRWRFTRSLGTIVLNRRQAAL